LIKREWTLLFSEYDLRAVLEKQAASIRDRVLHLDQSSFDADSDEFISAELASALVVAPLELLEDKIAVSSRDAKIDVSHDFARASWGDGPTYADGLEVTYHLAFAGDPELWRCRPSQFTPNPPRGVIGSGELTFPIDQPDRDVAATKNVFLEDLARVKQWVSWVNSQVAEYNARLEGDVRRHVLGRRSEVERTRAALDALGYKVRADNEETAVSPAGEDRANRRSKQRQKAGRSFDVALSFAGEDREYVENVANALAALGITVFYDRFEQVNLWGADLAEHLGRVYGKDSRFVVLFASRHYAAKAWPNHEKQFALARHLKGDKGRLLPVRFDETEIPGLPPTMGYLDVRALGPEKLAELIRQKVDTDSGNA